jgi:hypothetical protein
LTSAQKNNPGQLLKLVLTKLVFVFSDTDIDWVDLADDIRHEYFVIDNLRPSHGYKFRIQVRTLLQTL